MKPMAAAAWIAYAEVLDIDVGSLWGLKTANLSQYRTAKRDARPGRLATWHEAWVAAGHDPVRIIHHPGQGFTIEKVSDSD